MEMKEKLLSTLKQSVLTLVGSEKYSGSTSRINSVSSDPAVSRFLAATISVLSHGVDPRCTFWDFVKNSHVTLSSGASASANSSSGPGSSHIHTSPTPTRKSGDKKPSSDSPSASTARKEQVTAVYELARDPNDGRQLGVLWILLCLNTNTLVDALTSLGEFPEIITAFYTPTAMVAQPDLYTSFLQILRPILSLRFDLNCRAISDVELLSLMSLGLSLLVAPSKGSSSSSSATSSSSLTSPTHSGTAASPHTPARAEDVAIAKACIQSTFERLLAAAEKDANTGDGSSSSSASSSTLEDIRIFKEGQKILQEVTQNEELLNLAKTLQESLTSKGSIDGVFNLSQLKAAAEKVLSSTKGSVLAEVLSDVWILIDKGDISIDDVKETVKQKYAAVKGSPCTEAELAVIEEAITLYKEFADNPIFTKLKQMVMRAVEVVKQRTQSWQNAIESNEVLGSTLIQKETEALQQTFQADDELRKMIDELTPTFSSIMMAVAEIGCSKLPTLKLPRLHGLFESPIGKVCYHLGNLQFSSFLFPPDKIGINSITTAPTEVSQEVFIKDVSASLDNLLWQFGQMTFPTLTGSGSASVKVEGAVARLFYRLSFNREQCKVVIAIHRVAVELTKLDVSVDNNSVSWIYNLLLSVLNKKLRGALDHQLTTLLTSKLGSAAAELNRRTFGYIELQVCAPLESPPAEDDMSLATQAALKGGLEYAFLSPFILRSPSVGTIEKMNALSVSHFIASTQFGPALLLFSSKEEVPPLFQMLAEKFGKYMFFGFIPASDTFEDDHYGVTARPALFLIPQRGLVSMDTGPAPKVLRYEDEIQPDTLGRFVSHFCFGKGAVTVLNDLSLKVFVETPAWPSSVLVLFVDIPSKDEKQRVKDLQHEVAYMYQYTEPSVLFGYLSPTVHLQKLCIAGATTGQAADRSVSSQSGHSLDYSALATKIEELRKIGGGALIFPLPVSMDGISALHRPPWLTLAFRGKTTASDFTSQLNQVLLAQQRDYINLTLWNLPLFLTHRPDHECTSHYKIILFLAGSVGKTNQMEEALIDPTNAPVLQLFAEVAKKVETSRQIHEWQLVE